MKIAVEGCAHGELDKIYDTIEHIQEKENVKIDLLICCGDFQATRNCDDLQTMAVPRKYQSMCSFYKYYAGEKIAPILTIFIGGNHEASNYLQELPYGGWVAPNIYYLGYANVVNVAGVRIAGISGIYKGHDYMRGHFEKPPYTEETKRSVYHIRSLEVFRLKQLQEPLDIFLSHDWPRGIYQYGDTNGLLKRKPFFSSEVESNTLGSKPAEELLQHLKPKFWFAAHMHVKFAALYPHNTAGQICAGPNVTTTKFLALDKCLPRRQFLQVLDFPHDADKAIKLEYDLEWLTILHTTNHLLSVKRGIHYMPGPGNNERWTFAPTIEEKDLIKKKFDSDFHVPHNFCRTVIPYDGNPSSLSNINQQVTARINPQTTAFCEKLGVDDPLILLLMNSDVGTSGADLFSPNNSQQSNASLPSFLTPEKSGDLTRVSLSPDSEDAVHGTVGVTFPGPVFGEAVDVNYEGHAEHLRPLAPLRSTNQDISPKRPPRLSLVLPSPQYSDVDESIPDTDTESTPSSAGCSSLTAGKLIRCAVPSPLESDIEEKPTTNSEHSCENNANNSYEGDIPHGTSPATEVVETPHPQVKKFKRRNESLYANNLDED